MTPKTFILPAGSYTNTSNNYVLLIPLTFTANRVILVNGQSATVPSGGALALQGTLEDLRGYV